MLIFEFLGAGSVVGVQRFRDDIMTGAGLSIIALGHGFSLAVAIYAVGEVSGGNKNYKNLRP